MYVLGKNLIRVHFAAKWKAIMPRNINQNSGNLSSERLFKLTTALKAFAKYNYILYNVHIISFEKL